MTCPGYGLRIQFGQGVASRGKLMGKALPVIEPSPAAAAPAQAGLDVDVEAKGVSPGSRSGRSDDERGSVTSPFTLTQAFPSGYDETAFHNQFALGLDLSPYMLPQYLQGRPVKELIHYYDHYVAGLMPWVDGPNNAWRKLMLPLAFQSQSQALLLALLALSAEHYSARPSSSWSGNDGFLSRTYRDKSLLLLAQDLQVEIDEDASPARQLPASSILATILVLCNLEMIRCDTTTWHVHWKAARTITRRWTAPHLAMTILDDTCRFLLKEAFIYDVFGSSTTFGDTDQIPSTILSDSDSDAFTHWLQLVQEVTCVERRRTEGSSPLDTLPPELANIHVLQQRFHHARDRSQEFIQSVNFGAPGPIDDFLVLIDIFYYAGLAYSVSTLFDFHDPAIREAIDSNVVAVINTIAQIEHNEAYQHDLVWPLFVVGTQSRSNKGWQGFADSTLTKVMESTGFSNCVPALEFLRRFWQSDPNVVADWMQFARWESQHGRHFLVI
jgi:hypothetical protein